jgi:hypothetical protein
MEPMPLALWRLDDDQSDEPVIEALALLLPRASSPAIAALRPRPATSPLVGQIWSRLGGRRFGDWQFVDAAIAERLGRGAREILACGPAGALLGLDGDNLVLWPPTGTPYPLRLLLRAWLDHLLAWTEHEHGGSGCP